MRSLEEIIQQRERELSDITYSHRVQPSQDPTFYLKLDKSLVNIKCTFRYDTSPPEYIFELSHSEKLPNFNRKFDSDFDYSVDFGYELLLHAIYNDKTYTYSYGKFVTMAIEKSKYDERFDNLGIKSKSKKNILSFHNQNKDHMTFEYDENTKEIEFYKGSFKMLRDDLFEECFGK